MSLTEKAKRPFTLAILLVAAGLIFSSQSAFADTYTFTALPGPGVSHTTPGSTVGWGYSITNNSATNWLVVYGLSAGSFPGATPNPYFFDFPSIAPGSSRIVPYNPFSPYGYSFVAQNGLAHPVLNLSYNPVTNPFNALGLYQVTIGPNVPLGTVFSGNVVINALWFNGDPDTNLAAQLVAFAPDASAPYSLVGMGIFGLAFGVRRKRKSQNLP